MELIERLKRIMVDIWLVVSEHPVAFGVILVIVFGAAFVAAKLDEAGREVDALIEDALDPKENER